jgi:hypothetical protein
VADVVADVAPDVAVEAPALAVLTSSVVLITATVAANIRRTIIVLPPVDRSVSD